MKGDGWVNATTRSTLGPTVHLLMDLSRRFYIAGQTQIEIARSLDLDPSMVSRYLKRARDLGMIRVDIQPPGAVHHDLALELAERFHLKHAIVVAGLGSNLTAIARAAASYIDSQLVTRMRLGVSWGRMLSAAIHMMPAGTVSELDISMLNGGVSSDGVSIQGHELARHLASLHPGSRVHLLHAPILVDSPDIKRAMMRDRSIRAALKRAAACKLALVGIATLDKAAPLVRYGHISARDRESLLAAGAVGAVSAQFFTGHGDPVPLLDDRLIAIERHELRRVPLVVAPAAGLDERDAILGALRAGCVNVLVTDEPTAREVLRAAGHARATHPSLE
jgi:DNA-binding transcriptional regulator LsrR (DeoR family)